MLKQGKTNLANKRQLSTPASGSPLYLEPGQISQAAGLLLCGYLPNVWPARAAKQGEETLPHGIGITLAVLCPCPLRDNSQSKSCEYSIPAGQFVAQVIRVFNTFRTTRSPSHASIQYLQDKSQSKSCEYSIPSGQLAVQAMRVFNIYRTIRSPSHASIQYLQAIRSPSHASIQYLQDNS
ncbi:hypothetical protein RRG08_015187 [Elysia crispata]|uniref:Uncharacterized protein n=1 Tax=Elysia crispata TaxID=231223 RepID=A0AAE1E7E7_9GAST|nr:hypothetical protein RRG08_015187 [Elysia crispata]